METMVSLGVPYSNEDISNALEHMNIQAKKIVENLFTDPDLPASFKEEKEIKGADFIPVKDREIIALIAYLQRLGTDIKVTPEN